MRQASVIWITGLSGSGKSTVAQRVWQSLRAQGIAAIHLDGDRLREVLGVVAAHSPGERLELARIYGRMCKMLAEQGMTVVCATISMYHAVRRWNRSHIPGYREVWLRVPLDELKRRDPKGLYTRGNDMAGIDLPYEEPENPDLIIDNYGTIDSARAEQLILALLENPS